MLAPVSARHVGVPLKLAIAGETTEPGLLFPEKKIKEMGTKPRGPLSRDGMAHITKEQAATLLAPYALALAATLAELAAVGESPEETEANADTIQPLLQGIPGAAILECARMLSGQSPRDLDPQAREHARTLVSKALGTGLARQVN